MKRFFAVAFLSLVSHVAVAQQQQGDNEVQLSGLYLTTTTEGGFGYGMIQGRFGKYFTDRINVAIQPTLNIVVAGGTTETTFGSGISASYSFLAEDAKTVPYLGANYFIADFSDVENTAAVGFQGGLKYYFTEKTAFDVGGNYLFSTSPDAVGGVLLFTLGISHLFTL